MMQPQRYAERTSYRPPAAWYGRLNSFGAALTSAGVGPRDAVALEVAGRTTGKVRSVPILRTRVGGADHLVSLAGESQWVRNVRAAGGRAVIRRRRARPVQLEELPVDERPAIIDAYLRRDGATPRHDGQQAEYYFGLPPSPSMAELREVAGYYPVFRIAYLDERPHSQKAARRRRPATVTAAAGALGFLGATALGGGIEMWAYPHGNTFVEPGWLDNLPVSTWRLPGAVLAGVFGLGSLMTAWGLVTRSPSHSAVAHGLHWSGSACLALGLGLEAWIATEVALLPDRSPIEALYAVVGAALVGLPLTPSARGYLATARSGVAAR